MARMRFEGTTELTESIQNQCAVIKDSGGIQGTRIMTFESQEGGMLLTVDLEYIFPVPLLGQLAEPFIHNQNENEADVFLANLKARLGS